MRRADHGTKGYFEIREIRLCEIVTASGADYIKTSTGFGGGGASRLGTSRIVKAVKVMGN